MKKEDVAVNIGAVLIDSFEELDMIDEEEREKAKGNLYKEYLDIKGIQNFE